MERLLLWRVWERMLEIEFIDRSVALAGKAFVSFFPLVIVVAAFMPESIRSSIITDVTVRLGLRGDALTLTREAFASSDDVRQATGRARARADDLLRQLVHDGVAARLLPRVAATAPRRRRRRTGVGWCACCAVLARHGAPRWSAATTSTVGSESASSPSSALAATSALWWFSAWFLLLGDVRARVLVPTGVITGVATAVYAASATIWMPEVVTSNEAQFGVFGVALALVTWFSGAAICVLVGACAGVGPRRGPRTDRHVHPRRRVRDARPPAPARRSRHPPASSAFATRSTAPTTRDRTT